MPNVSSNNPPGMAPTIPAPATPNSPRRVHDLGSVCERRRVRHHAWVGFGTEPLPVAVGAGVVVVAIALIPLWMAKNMQRRVRVYVGVRSAILAVIGVVCRRTDP